MSITDIHPNIGEFASGLNKNFVPVSVGAFGGYNKTRKNINRNKNKSRKLRKTIRQNKKSNKGTKKHKKIIKHKKTRSNN